MTGTVFAIVMLAALLHAIWNAMVKGGADKAASMTAVIVGQGLFGLVLLPFAGVPAPEVWPWLLAGVVLHLGYNVFLIQAYRIGDLTQVYPIARGASPLLVVIGTALFFHQTFSTFELASILIISVGIASTSLARKADGLFQGKAALLALITGGFIAGYSIIDGHGARLAGSALGFYGWLAAIDGIAFLAGWAVVRPTVIRDALRLRKHFFLGGGASFTAYLLVVWAFTQAPIALVTALRETSIVFALLIGVTVLRERISLAKVVSTAMTLTGAIMLRLNRT